MCCTRLAENTGRKNYAKNRVKFVSSNYSIIHLQNVGLYSWQLLGRMTIGTARAVNSAR